MASGRRSLLIVSLSGQTRAELERWLRSTTICAGRARRAQIVLLRADGHTLSELARRVGVTRVVVYKWIKRFLKQGLRGLEDKPGRGRKPVFSPGGGAPSGQDRLRATG